LINGRETRPQLLPEEKQETGISKEIVLQDVFTLTLQQKKIIQCFK
jgi:hypothetical protein